MRLYMKRNRSSIWEHNSDYRERYQSFIRHTEKTFAADIQQTYDSVARNKWFKGAYFLHRAVKNLRDFVNSPTKPFMEWIGIEQDLTQMSQGIINLTESSSCHVVCFYDLVVARCNLISTRSLLVNTIF